MGLLFVGTLVLVAVFAWLLGLISPFANERYLNLAYNFAGGIEVGSPVRVMGIKVGKVHAIDFVPDQKLASGEEAKLRVRISISRESWETVRRDSRFFINLAGVIGEKYIEISPGSSASPAFADNELVRGEDPPRIDQLISQSYGLAGKVLEMIESNEGSINDTIEKLSGLLKNFNRTLVLLEKFSGDKRMQTLMSNLVVLTTDLTVLTGQLRGPQAEQALATIMRLLKKADQIDEDAIRKFLQKEGIRARMF